MYTIYAWVYTGDLSIRVPRASRVSAHTMYIFTHIYALYIPHICFSYYIHLDAYTPMYTSILLTHYPYPSHLTYSYI